MEILKDLELVEVTFEDKKAILTFLDEERGEIREINFNKQVYKDGKFIDDVEKAEMVEKWCKEIFKVKFADLQKAVGDKKDVYAYDAFNSLWEVDMVEKFDKDMAGQIFETKIESIEDDGKALQIRFKYDGNIYQSKMGYANYLEERKEWFVNPQKKKKQLQKFTDKFHIPFDDKDTIIGKKIMVEVKLAFNKFVYAEIKPFPKKK